MKWQPIWPGAYWMYWKCILCYFYLVSTNLKVFYSNPKCCVGLRSLIHFSYIDNISVAKKNRPIHHFPLFQRHSEEKIKWFVVFQTILFLNNDNKWAMFPWNLDWQKCKFHFLLTGLGKNIKMSCFFLKITRKWFVKKTKISKFF